MNDESAVIREMISPAITRLVSLGIEPELTFFPAVDKDQLDAFDVEFDLALPQPVRGLYMETDGFDIFWNQGEQWGSFSFPTLYELRLHRQRWLNGDMPDIESSEHLERATSERILRQMRSWLPIAESGGGDLMCIDCSDGRVVEYDHAWGNLATENGTVWAADLYDYIRRCARLCFHDVRFACREQVLRGSECWIDWNVTRVPEKYVIGEVDTT